MTLCNTVNYDTASELSFDTNKVETIAGETKLKLVFSPISDYQQDFTNDAGFTYDNTKSEFVGGVVRSKDQTPANSIAAATYTSTLNLSWSLAASLVGTPTGGASVVGNKLVCNGLTDKGVHYTDASYGVGGQGTLNFKYTPNYTGLPGSNINVISLTRPSGGPDRVLLTHSPSGGTFRVTIFDSVGATVWNVLAIGGNPNFVAGTTYEIEFSWDSVTGKAYIFIDGSLHGSLTTGAWTNAATATRLTVGAEDLVYNLADASYEDVILYNAVQHTSGYVPSVAPALEQKYAETKIDLPTENYTGPGNIIVASIPTTIEIGLPRYIIQGFYWNSTGLGFWDVSNGSFAQASTKAEVQANISSFDSDLPTIDISVVFGTTSVFSSVDQIKFSLAGEFYPTDGPTVTTNGYTQMDALASFEAVETAVGSDDIKWLVGRSNVIGGPEALYWWNGAVWAISNGSFAQSSSAADISANAATLDLSGGYFIRFFAVLHSDDGTTTPSITSHTVCFSFFITPDTLVKCLVYGWLLDPDSAPLVGAVVRVRNKVGFYNANQYVPKSEADTTTDANGYWEMSLIETTTVSKSYDFIYEYDDEFGAIEKILAKIVPAQQTANIEDLLGA